MEQASFLNASVENTEIPICSWNYIYTQLTEDWYLVQRFVLYTTEECYVTKEVEDYFSVI